MSNKAEDMNRYSELFSLCSNSLVEQRPKCPPSAKLAKMLLQDLHAEFPKPLHCGDEFMSQKESQPCVRYVAVRRALSTGNYGVAEGQLAPVSNLPSARSCNLLLVLEKARLLWFVDEFGSALEILKTIQPEPMPFAYHRAQDMIASCLLELFCLKSLGYPLPESAESHIPVATAFKPIVEELEQVSLAAKLRSDNDAANWANFNAYLANGLAYGRLNRLNVNGLVNELYKNGQPHALRRAGLAFAHLNKTKDAIELLRQSHCLAEDLYPGNLITLKAVLNLALLTHKQTTDTTLRRPAFIMLQSVIYRFVANQPGLAKTSLAKAVNNVSQQCLGGESDAAASILSEQDITDMLILLSPAQMEIIAHKLLEMEYGRAEYAPVNNPGLDMFAYTSQRNIDLRYAVQVKTGKTTLKKRDIPGIQHLLPDYKGFIAIAATRLAGQAVKELALLEKWNVVVKNCTGKELATLVKKHKTIGMLVQRYARTSPLVWL